MLWSVFVVAPDARRHGGRRGCAVHGRVPPPRAPHPAGRRIPRPGCSTSRAIPRCRSAATWSCWRRSSGSPRSRWPSRGLLRDGGRRRLRRRMADSDAPRISAHTIPPPEASERMRAQATASYEATPDEVNRVLLLYSGGLDTSVMLKWIQDEYDAEVVTLTVNLGQPGEDYEVVEGKARQLGAVDTYVVDAREEFAQRLHRPGDQGQRDLRARLPALHRARPAAHRQARRRVRAQVRLRHDRARLHRQGQRPGPDRGARSRRWRPSSRSSRRSARGRWAATRRSRTRASTGSRSRAASSRRRTRSTTTSGAARRRASGSRTSPTRPRTTCSTSSRGPRRRRTSRRSSRSSSSRASRSR